MKDSASEEPAEWMLISRTRGAVKDELRLLAQPIRLALEPTALAGSEPRKTGSLS